MRASYYGGAGAGGSVIVMLGVELQKGAGCVVVESKQGKSPEQKDTQGSKRHTHTHTHQSIGRD